MFSTKQDARPAVRMRPYFLTTSMGEVVIIVKFVKSDNIGGVYPGCDCSIGTDAVGQQERSFRVLQIPWIRSFILATRGFFTQQGEIPWRAREMLFRGSAVVFEGV